MKSFLARGREIRSHWRAQRALSRQRPIEVNRASALEPPPAYVCPLCGARSWNPNDAKHRYCGRCNVEQGR